jgi:hypothetical protein
MAFVATSLRAIAAVPWFPMDRARMRSPGVGVMMAMLAGAVAGCGSKDGVPLDDLVAEHTAAECAMWTRCHVSSDQAYCVAVESTFGTSDRLARDVAAVKAGKAKYDGSMARACLDSFAKTSCDELWSGGVTERACQGTFSSGTTADGYACAADVECLPGSYCYVYTGGSCTGICTRSSTCQCPIGQYCSLFDGCQPQGKEGDYCDWVTGCAAGLTCTPTNDPTTIVAACRKIAGKGEPCEAVNQCGGIIWSTIKCDMTSHVCVDNTSDGACFSVDSDARAANGCDPFTSYCDDSTSTLTCKPYTAALGDPCIVNRAECGVSAWCQPDPNDSTGMKGFCTANSTCTP